MKQQLQQLKDRKHWLTYAFWSTVNKIVIRHQFRSINVTGWQHLPQSGKPFILVSNHSARWDGLLIYFLLDRPANFVVSPNELLGLQGRVLRSMGAFPAASTRFDLVGHVIGQLNKGEPVVVFPEGDIYRDGPTRRFKSGAARFAVAAAQNGIDIPIIPVAITYSNDGRSVSIKIAEPVRVEDYVESQDNTAGGARILTERLRREVCHLKYELGSRADVEYLFGTALPVTVGARHASPLQLQNAAQGSAV